MKNKILRTATKLDLKSWRGWHQYNTREARNENKTSAESSQNFLENSACVRYSEYQNKTNH